MTDTVKVAGRKRTEVEKDKCEKLPVLTLLHYTGQRGFEYHDTVTTRKIYTAMMRSLNSSKKQVTLFLKINITCMKNRTVICDVLKINWTKYFKLFMFFNYSSIFSPSLDWIIRS